MWQLIAMFLCGFLFSFSIVGLLVTHQLFKEEKEEVPYTDEDMEQMSMWYENEYGKGKHES